jgi:hypothetical protein
MEVVAKNHHCWLCQCPDRSKKFTPQICADASYGDVQQLTLDASAATAGIVPLHYTAPAAQRLFHRIHSPPKRHGTERCIRYSRGEGWFMDGLWMVYGWFIHPF